MKKVITNRLSNKEKRSIIERIKGGERISHLGREINISRTTLYKWLKTSRLEGRGLSRRGCRREIPASKRRGVIKLALRYPNYSIRQISAISGLSVGFVWLVMKRYSLSNKKQRQAHFLAKGTSIYRRIRGVDKMNMVGRYMAGERVTRICSDYGVSRTIFYRWISKYNKAGDEFDTGRPKGSHHWRFIRGMDKVVRDLVAKNPELSLSQLHNRINSKYMNVISRSGLYYVCRRLELTTYEGRLFYARSGGVMGISIGRRYLWDEISLLIQLMILSFFSLVFSLTVLVVGQRVGEYENALKSDLARIEPDRRVSKEEPKSKEIIYIVQAGDSLWHISEEIFESGYNWVDIAESNRLSDPDYVEIGQRLIIPAVSAKESTIAMEY